MSENMFGYQKWDGALTKDTDKHPTMHRTATHSKDLYAPKYQQC